MRTWQIKVYDRSPGGFRIAGAKYHITFKGEQEARTLFEEIKKNIEKGTSETVTLFYTETVIVSEA